MRYCFHAWVLLPVGGRDSACTGLRRFNYASRGPIDRKPGVLGPVPQSKLDSTRDCNVGTMRLKGQRNYRIRISNRIKFAILRNRPDKNLQSKSVSMSILLHDSQERTHLETQAATGDDIGVRVVVFHSPGRSRVTLKHLNKIKEKRHQQSVLIQGCLAKVIRGYPKQRRVGISEYFDCMISVSRGD